MNILKAAVIGFVFSYFFISSAQAEEAALKGVKLGFGFDQGFGVVASMGGFNGVLGDDGVALDYVLMKDELKVEVMRQ